MCYIPEGLSLPYNTALIGGAVVFIIVSILYVRAILKQTEPITSPTQDLYTS